MRTVRWFVSPPRDGEPCTHGWVLMHDAKRSSFFYSWRKIAVVFPAHMSLSRRQRDYPRGNKMET